jgi:hypothetical protein
MIQNINHSNSLKLSNKIKQNNSNKSFNIKKIIIENINIENKKIFQRN